MRLISFISLKICIGCNALSQTFVRNMCAIPMASFYSLLFAPSNSNCVTALHLPIGVMMSKKKPFKQDNAPLAEIKLYSNYFVARVSQIKLSYRSAIIILMIFITFIVLLGDNPDQVKGFIETWLRAIN